MLAWHFAVICADKYLEKYYLALYCQLKAAHLNFLKAEFLLNKKDVCAEDVKWMVLKYFALLRHLILCKHLQLNFCQNSGS